MVKGSRDVSSLTYIWNIHKRYAISVDCVVLRIRNFSPSRYLRVVYLEGTAIRRRFTPTSYKKTMNRLSLSLVIDQGPANSSYILRRRNYR